MKKLRYVGSANYRQVTVADMAKLDVDMKDDIQLYNYNGLLQRNNLGWPRTQEVKNEVADTLIELEGADWQVVEPDAPEPEEPPVVYADLVGGGVFLTADEQLELGDGDAPDASAQESAPALPEDGAVGAEPHE